jgi:hypothetical protein
MKQISRKQIINVIIIAAIILATIFITKSCEQDTPILDTTKYTELVTKHNTLQKQYTQDSTDFNTRVNYLNYELAVLTTSKDSIYSDYVNILNKYNNTPDEPETIIEFVESCSDLVVTQDSIIKKQDTIIVEQLEFIEVQEIHIADRDSLLVASNESLLQSNIDYQKSQKKLKRTRKIGVGAFFVGILGGIITALSIK